MILRKIPKNKVIVDDIVSRLKTRTLKPGDHLCSYKELMAAYKVSQGPLAKALSELEARGLIERRRRSLCRVSMDAHVKLAQTASSQPAVPSDDTHRRMKWLMNYSPYSSRRSLRLFLTDGYPEHLVAWREVLAEFRKSHPEISVAIDSAGMGSSHAVAGRADIVQAVPWFVKDLREYGFVPYESIGELAPRAEDLVPPAAELLAAGSSLVGVPFEIMPVLLTINEKLRRESGEILDFETVPCLMESISRAIANLRNSVWGAHLGTLFGLLFPHGGLIQNPDGVLGYDPGAASQVVENYIKLASFSNGLLWHGNDSELLAGKILTSYEGLYIAIALRRQRRFEWSLQLVPPCNKGRPLLVPIVLAIRRDSPVRRQCEDLVRHLCGLRSQKRFAMTGGSLPVLEKAFHDSRVQDACPLVRQQLRTLVESGSLTWTLLAENCWLEHEIDKTGCAIAEHVGTSSFHDTMQHIFRTVQTYRRMRGSHAETGGTILRG